ncbi:MAG: hypothetical protein LIO86_10770 [Lachnospiraceae bacterium]|nr:hypothetical protein [Lachnospiraceae bacterium]
MRNQKRIIRWYVVFAAVALLVILIGIALPARRADDAEGVVGEMATELTSDMDMADYIKEHADEIVELFAGTKGEYPDFPSDMILIYDIDSLGEVEDAEYITTVWYAAGEALVTWLDDEYCTQIFGETNPAGLWSDDFAEAYTSYIGLKTAYEQILEYLCGGEHPELAIAALQYYYHDDGSLGTEKNPTQAWLDGEAFVAAAD